MTCTGSTLFPQLAEGLDIVASVSDKLQVMVVIGPAGFLGHYRHHDALGKVLDDLSDKFGVSQHAVQLSSCSGTPLFDGLSLRRLRDHTLYEKTCWNYENRKREAANHVIVPAGQHLVDDVLARILGCSLDMSIAETLGCLPLVHALAPFNPQGPVRRLSLAMSRASAQRAGHWGSRHITIAITRSCTWRHLKQKLASELQGFHCKPHEIMIARKGKGRITEAQQLEKVWEVVPEGNQVSFRLSMKAGGAPFCRIQRMPAPEQTPSCASAEVSLKSMALAFERKQPGIALKLAALNVSSWRDTTEPSAEPFIPGTNAVEWSTSGGICVEQLPLLLFAREPVIQVWPRQWLLEALWVLQTTGLPKTLRRIVVHFCALPPKKWWRGLEVSGQTIFKWQRTAAGNDSLLASFVPTTPLLPGILSVSSYGLKTGSPTGGRQQEISVAWLVKVSAGSHRFAGPFPVFDSVGYDYGGGPIVDALQPGIIPAAWIP